MSKFKKINESRPTYKEKMNKLAGDSSGRYHTDSQIDTIIGDQPSERWELDAYRDEGGTTRTSKQKKDIHKKLITKSGRDTNRGLAKHFVKYARTGEFRQERGVKTRGKHESYEENMNINDIVNNIIKEAFTSGDRNNTTSSGNGLADKGGAARQMLSGSWFGSTAWPFDQVGGIYNKAANLQLGQSKEGQGERTSKSPEMIENEVGNNLVNKVLEDTPSYIYSDPSTLGYFLNELEEEGYSDYAEELSTIAENLNETSMSRLEEIYNELVEADHEYFASKVASFYNKVVDMFEQEAEEETEVEEETEEDEVKKKLNEGHGSRKPSQIKKAIHKGYNEPGAMVPHARGKGAFGVTAGPITTKAKVKNAAREERVKRDQPDSPTDLSYRY